MTGKEIAERLSKAENSIAKAKLQLKSRKPDQAQKALRAAGKELSTIGDSLLPDVPVPPPTIRLQLVERDGTELYKTRIADMRSGKLEMLIVSPDGRKVTHAKFKKARMNLALEHGVVVGEIKCSAGPDGWKLLQAVVGRLADKYPDRVESVAIQFTGQ